MSTDGSDSSRKRKLEVQKQNSVKIQKYVLNNKEINWLIMSTKKLMKTIPYNDDDKISPENIEQFKKISLFLSCLLPNLSDESLSVIDDIIYPNDYEPHRKVNATLPEDSRAFVIETCLKSLQKYYYMMVSSDIDQVHCVIDRALLQLIENSSDEMFNRMVQNDYLGSTLSDLIQTRTDRYICRAIKFLKAILNKKGFNKVINNADMKDLLWLSSLTSIKEAKDPQKKRMSTWLSNQCTIIFEKVNLFEMMGEDGKKSMKMMEKLKEKSYGRGYLKLVSRLGPNQSLKVDHLYRYFKSAQNEAEKLQRAKDFLEASMEKDSELDIEERVMEYIKIFIENDYSFFLDIIYNWHPEDETKLVDKHHCNDMEPYISPNENDFSKQEMSNKIMDSEDQRDFTIEKCLFYDEFLKHLYVMSRIYDACSRSKELLNAKDDFTDFGEVFRDKDIKHFINIRLLKEKECDGLPWWLHTTFQKCPFLVLPKRHKNLIGDVEKMLKGEQIDDVTLERLYYAINSSPCIEEGTNVN